MCRCERLLADGLSLTQIPAFLMRLSMCDRPFSYYLNLYSNARKYWKLPNLSFQILIKCTYVSDEILYDVHISILLQYKNTIVQMLSTKKEIKTYFYYLLKQHYAKNVRTQKMRENERASKPTQANEGKNIDLLPRNSRRTKKQKQFYTATHLRAFESSLKSRCWPVLR